MLQVSIEIFTVSCTGDCSYHMRIVVLPKEANRNMTITLFGKSHMSMDLMSGFLSVQNPWMHHTVRSV